MAFYLVTGGAGFIGSHMVARLLMDGHRVRVVDDFSSGRKENLIFGPSVDTSHLEVIEGDLRDLDLISRAATGVEGIFHLGAVPSVNRSVKDPITTTDVNVIGTLNVLKAARIEGGQR
jgi:UDP-glucose 4-epimerase